MTRKLFFILFVSFNIKILSNLYPKDSKELERITNTIRLILSLDKEVTTTSFSIEYPKYILYVIRFSNLVIFNPNEILVTQDENDPSQFIAHNVTTEQILLCKLSYLSTANLFDYNFNVEMHYSKIIFTLNSSYGIHLFLQNFTLDSYKIEPTSGISNLDYFKLLNKGAKAKYKYNDKTFEINSLYETLSEKSMEFFNIKIKKVGKKFNLLTYDLYNILNNSLPANISCSENTVKNYNISYIYFSNIKTYLEYLDAESHSNGLLIYDIEFTGYYKSNLFENVINFSILSDYERASALYPKQLYLNLDKKTIKGDIFDKYTEQVDAIYNAIDSDYLSSYLKVIVKNYFDSFSN